MTTIDWTEPAFVEAVAALAPLVPAIQTWLQQNTSVRSWTAEAAHPRLSAFDKGAVARFSGCESASLWWFVEVEMVGGVMRVYANAPEMKYPGWRRDRTVAAGVPGGDIDGLFRFVAAPLSFIMKKET